MLEDAELIKFFDWVHWNEKIDTRLALIYHIANERRTTWRQGALLKRKGVRSGVLDICIPIPAQGFHGFYIELKVGKNKPTESQTKFIELAQRQKYKCLVCYSGDEAIKELQEYLKINSHITL